jgi:predicted AlkP superfamily pyrophosphatase or phosphodiesterase
MRKLRQYFLFLGLFFSIERTHSQTKLVIGIVVDQMRNDYLDRFSSKWGEDGFKALMEEGFWCKNTHYNYFPTYTGPGHASIYTGTTPSVHGIIANDWYDRSSKQEIYCVSDPNVSSVGTSNDAGKMSPSLLKGSPITDQLKLSTQFNSKVIGISLKDRGAILPAGFFADAAYWFDSKSGNMISSTFYMDTLPNWVSAFNDKKWPDHFLDQTWNTILPIEQYTESMSDNNRYETIFKGKQSPTFPYPLARLRKNYKNFDLLKYTPFGNTLIADFSIEAIENERLGQDSIADFLCISFSSTDYVGHDFGPRSVELEDTYLRLDRDLAKLFQYLDEKIGYDHYVLFLTSDHGVAENSMYLADHRKNVGIFESNKAIQEINLALLKADSLGTDTLVHYGNQQFYFANSLKDHSFSESFIRSWIQNKPGIIDFWSSDEVKVGNDQIISMYKNGFQSLRSGDFFIHFAPGWTEYKTVGATHGSVFQYDTHVPLLWSGSLIPKGQSTKHHNITDIAKTLAFLLKINEPEGCSGEVIQELLPESKH